MNPIAGVDAETGEFFCRIGEFWENENSYVGVWMRCRDEQPAAPGQKQVDAAPPAVEVGRPPDDRGRKMKKGRPDRRKRAARDLSDILKRRTG